MRTSGLSGESGLSAVDAADAVSAVSTACLVDGVGVICGQVRTSNFPTKLERTEVLDRAFIIRCKNSLKHARTVRTGPQLQDRERGAQEAFLGAAGLRPA
jgi:hypothetical protein